MQHRRYKRRTVASFPQKCAGLAETFEDEGSDLSPLFFRQRKTCPLFGKLPLTQIFRRGFIFVINIKDA